MIRLTKRADYGLVLLAHLSRRADRAVGTAREIAAETRLPVPIASQILKALAREGVLASHRGTKGGYALARSPESITVLEVLRILEGPIGLMECAAGIPGICGHEPVCGIRSHWRWINRAFLDAMENLTLAQMALPPAVFARSFRTGATAARNADSGRAN